MTTLKLWCNAMLVAALSLFAVETELQAAIPASESGGLVTSIAPMLNEVTPAVVHIATTGSELVRQRSFFNADRVYKKPTQGLGSGVIIDAAEGIVVTNSHVIADADEIKVTLKDGRSFIAEVLGTDPDADVAVLKINADNLIAIPLARSENVQVGDFVVAIGTPFGLEQTVTSGIVSALGRSGLGIERYENFIQTDASINPGNSGGALVNLYGELVGINTAILGSGGGSVGIGFAIPINMAKSISDELIKYGEVRRGMLGISIAPFSPEYAGHFKISEKVVGAIVTDVAAASPAAMAGLQAEDVIFAINDRQLKSTQDLVNRIGLFKLGETVKVDFYRAGKRNSKNVKIAALAAVKATNMQLNEVFDGAKLIEIKNSQGMLVAEVKPNSAAAQHGLLTSDVLLSVNRQPVNNVDEINAALSSRRDSVLLTIERNGFGLHLLVQ